MALAVISLKWVHREIHGKPPSPRQGHSACLVGNVAYMFGGIRSVDWPKRGTYFFRDLYQLHLYKRMQWEKVKQKGEIPKGRYGHHMCVIGHKIYLFGGKHELHADRCLSGLHVYDTEKKTWSQPQTSGTEPIAHGSTSSVVGNRIYVYGGLVDGQAVDDLHCFDSENQWWVKLTIQGVPPSPRCDSASTSVGHEIFVFGGTGGTDQWFNDIHVFNTKKLLWKELNKTDGEPPTPRDSHCFLAHVDKDIYVFGGSNDSNTSHPTLGDLYKFSLDKRKWKRPFYGGCPPAKRSGHAAIIHRNKLIIIGGSNEDTDFNDVHIAKLINPSKRQPLKVPAGDMHDFLDTLNNSNPGTMVVDGEDADAHFHEKEEDPETIPKEEEPVGGSGMEQNNSQHQTESPVTGSRDGSVAGSDADLKGSPGKSVHFEDDGEGKQDGASLSSSAGSLASSASSASSLSSASSSSASSSGSGGSDEQGSSNNNNSNNNNATSDIRRGTLTGVRSRIVPEDGAMTPDGGSEYVERSNSDKPENKGKVEAAGKRNDHMVSENKQVDGPVRSAGQGKPKLAPIAKTKPKPSTKKEGKKTGSQKKKPKKERSDGGLEDDTQTPVPAERRSYSPVDSHLDSHQHRAPEEEAWNHHPGDLRTFNQIHAQAHEPPQDEPESDEEESESEGGSGSGSGSSSEEESDDNDDDDGDDGESEDSDDGEANQSATPDEQSINGNDESLAYRPASQERPGESSKDEAESEDDDGSGSDDDDDDDDDDGDDDDSGSDGEEESADGSGSESESGSGSGSEDGSDSEED